VSSVAFGPGGTTLAAGAGNFNGEFGNDDGFFAGDIYLLDIAARKLIATLTTCGISRTFHIEIPGSSFDSTWKCVLVLA
jgi:hypothetical protein